MQTSQTDEDLGTNSHSSSRSTIFQFGVLGCLGGAALLVVFWFPPTDNRFYPRCAFFDWTGLHCPGCGGFRAWHLLLNGHLISAMRMNVLAVTVFPALVSWLMAERLFFRNGDGLSLRGWSRCYLWLAIIVLVFGFLRNIPLFPFTWLAP